MSARLRWDVTIKAASSVPPPQAALGSSTVTLLESDGARLASNRDKSRLAWVTVVTVRTSGAFESPTISFEMTGKPNETPGSLR
jgi:hypothetical protein